MVTSRYKLLELQWANNTKNLDTIKWDSLSENDILSHLLQIYLNVLWCRWHMLRFDTGWVGGIPFSIFLASPVLSDVTRDYFSQIVLCVGIIISQNVLWLEIVFPSAL